MLQVANFTFNPIAENTYLVFNEHKNAIVIDPGMFFTNEEETLIQFITDNDLIVQQLINTHCHFDHIFGNKFIAKTFDIKPKMHPNEIVILQNSHIAAERWGFYLDPFNYEVEFLNNEDIIKLDEDELQVLFVPGHSPGHIALYCAKQNFVINGDVLFNGGVGRTDLPYCNHTDLEKSIRDTMFNLPEQTVVYCGHGDATTIANEKNNNVLGL